MAGLVPRGRSTARSTTPASTWPDIDAVVIGKAPDMFEGVMMPELYLADALGAAGKPMLRVHTAGSVGGSTAIVAASLVHGRRARAGARGRVREAVRVERDVGAVGRDAVPRRRSSPARAATSRRTSAPTSAASGAPDAHRRAGRGQGPAQRRAEPVRAPAAARHHVRRRCGRRRCCGTRSATTRPARPPTARARWCSASEDAAAPAPDRWRGSTPPRCAPSRRCSPAATR